MDNFLLCIPFPFESKDIFNEIYIYFSEIGDYFLYPQSCTLKHRRKNKNILFTYLRTFNLIFAGYTTYSNENILF